MSAIDVLSETELEVRDALPDDVHAIAAIYAWHVLHGRASFEEVPPTIDEMRQRMKSVAESGLPWLIALYRGIVVGYCYATPYRPRHAYRYTLEESIYVDASITGRGFGTALMDSLIARCEQGPWRQMIAVVGHSGNAGSIALHSSFGFQHMGVLRSVGFKLGQWVDIVLMQRPLGQGDASRPTD